MSTVLILNKLKIEDNQTIAKENNHCVALISKKFRRESAASDKRLKLGPDSLLLDEEHRKLGGFIVGLRL